MAAKIPQSFIDELMNRVDIVEVIDARVSLRKTGRDYSACCPFHDEKTPSFTVSPTKQFYHCFGCGAHGTAISFLMEYERMGFLEAVRDLASRVGMQVPEADGARPDSHLNELYALLEKCAVFYHQALLKPQRGTTALQYLERRGLPDAVVKEYLLGFAPDAWEELTHALGKERVAQEKLAAAGMTIKKSGGGYYDRFRNRVMFPIRDQRGRVIGFGGRVLDDATPKYLNSPETPVFHKGRELYGLYEVRQSAQRHERLVVVEGYMDVLALAAHGIRNAVATLGTATTHEHLERLYRLVPEVVFCFDGDTAGRRAAWRALENALPVLRDGRQARFMFLPEGEDPDTLVQKEGKQSFDDRVAHSVPLSTYFFESLSRDVDITTIDGRSRLAELARPHLSKLPVGVFKHMMLSRLAEIAQTDAETLTRFISTGKGPLPAPRPRRPLGRPLRPQATASPMQQAIRLLLTRPDLARIAEAPGRLAGSDLPGAELLKQLLELLINNPHLSSSAVVERWRDREEGRYLMKLAQWQHPLAEADLEAEFSGAMQRVYAQINERRINQLLAKPDATPEEKVELNQLLSWRRPASSN